MNKEESLASEIIPQLLKMDNDLADLKSWGLLILYTINNPHDFEPDVISLISRNLCRIADDLQLHWDVALDMARAGQNRS